MKIYFAASIRGGRDDIQLYSQIVEEIKKHATVLTEHIGTPSLTVNGEHSSSDEFIYQRDKEWLESADAVIAEVTQPSLGVGYELGFAESKNIPVFCLFRKNSERKLSAMIRGNNYFKVYEYSTIEEVKGIINKIIKP